MGHAALGDVTLRELLEMRSGIEVEAHGHNAVSGDKDVEATKLNLFGPMARLHTGGIEAIAAELKSLPELRNSFMGSRGQITYLMPGKDLVVVRFGDGFQKLHSTLHETWRSMGP